MCMVGYVRMHIYIYIYIYIYITIGHRSIDNAAYIST